MDALIDCCDLVARYVTHTKGTVVVAETNDSESAGTGGRLIRPGPAVSLATMYV